MGVTWHDVFGHMLHNQDFAVCGIRLNDLLFMQHKLACCSVVTIITDPMALSDA